MAALESDYRSAALPELDRAMLDFAHKLTVKPQTMRKSDVEALRGAGLEDPAILDIVQVTAYFAFANRLADGLGVELEELP